MSEALQLSLLSSDAMPAAVFEELEQRGVYTGARLRAQRPEVYERCVSLLREGVTPLMIEKALGIEHRTVEAVAAAHSIPIQTSKRRMAERFRFAADRLLDLMHRTGDAREAKDLMIGASCATDKWQLLDGQPIRRVDIEVTVTAEDWNGWIDSAAQKLGEKGGDDLAAGELEADCKSGARDAQVAGGQRRCITLDCAATGPATGNTPQTDQVADRGGGGLASFPAPADPPKVSGTENFPANGPSSPAATSES